MSQSEILKIFRDSGALLKGHFLLSSGLHSEQYLQCARVLENPQIAAQLCQALARHFKDEKVDVVIGPAIGGIIFAYELARALGARAIFAERESGKMSLRRGFAISAQDKALVAEDVITTGGSVKEVIELVRADGAQLIGVCALVDRSGAGVELGANLTSLLKIEVATFAAQECPLCKKGLPVVKPGSRAGK